MANLPLLRHANSSRNTPPPESRGHMLNSSKRFRSRAIDCRNLAKGARHSADVDMLEEIAAELDEEADRIECDAKRLFAESGPRH